MIYLDEYLKSNTIGYLMINNEGAKSNLVSIEKILENNMNNFKIKKY